MKELTIATVVNVLIRMSASSVLGNSDPAHGDVQEEEFRERRMFFGSVVRKSLEPVGSSLLRNSGMSKKRWRKVFVVKFLGEVRPQLETKYSCLDWDCLSLVGRGW